MPKVIAFKNIGIGLAALFVVSLLCILSLALFFPSSPIMNGNGGNNSSSSITTSTANTQILIDRNFQYAGITDKRMLDLLGTEREGSVELELESTIDLDNQDWREIKWSPGQDYVSVIGKVREGAKDDLLLYTPSRANWQTLTSFAESEAGIDNYFWETNSTIVFTQGSGANKWMHRYDLKNSELRKIFQVQGELSDYFSDRYVTTQPLGNGVIAYNIYQSAAQNEGSNLVATLTSDQLDLFAEVSAVNLGFGRNEIYVSGKNADGAIITAQLNLETSELTLINQTGRYEFLCRSTDTLAYMLLSTAESGTKVESYDPVSEISTEIFSRLSSNRNTVDSNSVECRDGAVLLKLVEERTPNSTVFSWVRVSEGDFDEVTEAFNYPDLSYRGVLEEE